MRKASIILREKRSKLVLTVLLFPFALLMLMPFLWMLSTSLKNSVEIWNYPIDWIPKTPLFSNYTQIWNHSVYPFSSFLVNSSVVALFTILGMLVLSASAAYAFTKIEFFGKNFIFLLYLSTLMIPTHITLIPRFVMMSWMNLYDTHYALILPSMFNMLGIFLLRQFYLSVPVEISEAAKIDGAGHLRIWLQMIIPLTKTAMASLVILGFVWSWNDYINPNIFITNKALYTIPVGLEVYKDNETIAYNLIMAASACAILPVVVVYLLGQKQFIRGITTSGLKG